MFNVVLTVRDNDDYRQAMQAVYDHTFTDVINVTRNDLDEVRTEVRVHFNGETTRNTDAHAYFAKRGIITHCETVS